jgi:hypothetical protein
MATKTSLYILGAVVILLNIISIVQVHNYAKTPMDWKIYKNAGKIWADGNDPYNQTNIIQYTGENYPYRYAPITLPFFFVITQFNHYLVWFIVCILIFLLIRKSYKDFNPMLFGIILLTVFMAAFKNFTIGNIGLLETLFLAAAVYFISKERYISAATLFGFMAIFKMVPLAYALIFLLIPGVSFWKKIGYGMVTGLTFFGLHVASYLLSPVYYESYLNLTFGGYPIVDSGGYFNPSTWSFFKEILVGNYTLILPVMLILAGLLIYSLYKLYKARSYYNDRLFYRQLFSFGILAIMLLLPELKHFSYVVAAIPIYFLITEMNTKQQLTMFVLVAIIPLVSALISFGYYVQMENTIWMIFYNYTPLLCLWMAYFILYKHHMR